MKNWDIIKWDFFLPLAILIIALILICIGWHRYYAWNKKFDQELAVYKQNEQLINNRDLEEWKPRGLEMPQLQTDTIAPPKNVVPVKYKAPKVCYKFILETYCK